MPKIGHVRIRLHRDFDFRTAGTINIKLRGNDWYANITCEIPIAVSSTEPSKSIGIDVGLYIFVATSKGDLIDNPRGVFTSTL
jgi:putative transposase